MTILFSSFIMGCGLASNSQSIEQTGPLPTTDAAETDAAAKSKGGGTSTANVAATLPQPIDVSHQFRGIVPDLGGFRRAKMVSSLGDLKDFITINRGARLPYVDFSRHTLMVTAVAVACNLGTYDTTVVEKSGRYTFQAHFTSVGNCERAQLVYRWYLWENKVATLVDVEFL